MELCFSCLASLKGKVKIKVKQKTCLYFWKNRRSQIRNGGPRVSILSISFHFYRCIFSSKRLNILSSGSSFLTMKMRTLHMNIHQPFLCKTPDVSWCKTNWPIYSRRNKIRHYQTLDMSHRYHMNTSSHKITTSI